MIKKAIILSFLLLAWTIIFVHSIVPHHHHYEVAIECDHEHGHVHYQAQEISEVHSCNHDSNDHTCHFHVEIFTKVSIDNFFIVNAKKSLFADITCIETSNYSYYQEFVSEQVPKTNHLRGPPQFS